MADLCLTLTEDTLEGCRRQIEAESDRIGMAEVRLDLLSAGAAGGGVDGFAGDAARAAEFSRQQALPLILTVRLSRDGGRWQGAEEDRRRLMAAVLEQGAFAWVDVEEDTPLRPVLGGLERGGQKGVRVLRSFHCFDGLPEDWEARTAALLRDKENDGAKAAVSLERVKDLRSFFQGADRLKGLAEERGKVLVLVGMGRLGRAVRLLADRFGSAWSYASPPGDEAAPGQMTPEEMEDVYRFSSLGRETRIFGIIGNPLGQSRSPRIHNPALEQAGIDGVYLPFPVESPEGVREFFSLAGELPVEGFSVTVPYKEAVISHLDHPDRWVKAVGACNTVFHREDGWHGSNTDAPGFLSHLRQVFPGLDPQFHRAAVIGAGGAARAVVYALREAGFSLLVLNRTREKAEALAGEMGCAAEGLDRRGRERLADFRDLIVQTTSVGMPPLEGRDPLEGYSFTGDERVYDIIYKPPRTPLMVRAEAAGCPAVNGLGMLQAQGELQFRFFSEGVTKKRSS